MRKPRRLSHNHYESCANRFRTERIGDLRFAPPQPPQAFEGVYDATSYGAACYNQVGKPPAIDSSLPFNLSGGTPPANESEDCMYSGPGPFHRECTVLTIRIGLFVNVLTPASATAGDHLPVLFVRSHYDKLGTCLM